MIVSDHDALSVRRQSSILSLSRSGLYYLEQGKDTDSPALANEILEIWQSCPFYGYRRITAELRRRGYRVNGKRIIRLMRAMNIEAIYPGPKLSQANQAHQKYGYLLRDMAIHAGQVWCTDITYIKIGKGFVYLVALIDVYSRYIVAWMLSVTLDVHFCLEMLDDALMRHKVPEIINTDQGCQFTSSAWIEKVESAGIRVSMDGRGRWADNIPIERFWRTVKYEHVFLYCYESVQDARQRLGEFIDFYNERRLHQSLDYSTPSEVWRGLISVAPFCFKKRREENIQNAA